MGTTNLPSIKVCFTDSNLNYSTNVSHKVTEAEATEYFVGRYFDMGVYPKENVQKCISIEYTI